MGAPVVVTTTPPPVVWVTRRMTQRTERRELPLPTDMRP